MIQTGLEVLLNNPQQIIRNRRVGLITHPAAVTVNFSDAASALLGAGVNLCGLFGPEHGLYGAVADGKAVGHSIDTQTGLPAFSLYGNTKEPTPEMLEGLDVLVFDMQDVGVRFYTYLSTMVYVLCAAAKAGKAVIVLDRPNPLSGAVVEGPGVDPGYESFIGIMPIPVRHGLTLGELAGWVKAKENLVVDLNVVAMKGWSRNLWFDQTGLTWVPTSPAMPHLSTSVVYPGACLVEGTSLSEGRGTSLPFELVGAPGINAWHLAKVMNAKGLPGAVFRPAAFIPTSGKWRDQPCAGIQLHVIDRGIFEPLRSGLHLLVTLRELFPDGWEFLTTSWEGRPAHFDLLIGNSQVRQDLLAGAAADELVNQWKAYNADFQAESREYWLYQ